MSDLKPHYYAVVRWNEGAPPSVMLVEGPNGEFEEPTSRLFEELKKQDLGDPSNRRRLMERSRRMQEARDRMLERENAERQAEIKERVDAATRTFVSMNRSTPWTQNQSANSRRFQAEKRKRDAA